MTRYALFRGTAATLLLLAVVGCSGGSQSNSNTQPPGNGSGSNTAPTISGNPPSAVTVGQAYSFIPNASDADGDSLTFGVENLPGWAAFDTASGRIEGIPAQEHIGRYENITITVSDGTASTALASFYIDVSQVALASVTVSWTPPTTNTDGSTITNLAGYRIYFGSSAATLNQVVEIDNPGLSSYVIDSLTPGTYFFAATAFNLDGAESELSNTASVDIDAN